MRRCEKCGQILPDTLGIAFDGDSATVTRFNIVIKLNRQQSRIFELLYRRCGHAISDEVICAALWPNPQDEPEFTSYVIRTVVSRLRTKLRPLNLAIVHRWHIGRELREIGRELRGTDN